MIYFTEEFILQRVILQSIISSIASSRVKPNLHIEKALSQEERHSKMENLLLWYTYIDNYGALIKIFYPSLFILLSTFAGTVPLRWWNWKNYMIHIRYSYSNLSDKKKHNFFLSSGRVRSFIRKHNMDAICIKKKLDGNCTRMLQAILNKSHKTPAVRLPTSHL